ncbi:divalent metal cation transporter [Paraburkholderia sp. Ac-20340]|uniref:Nramp family divalent metal transporter n=1 Tax=Paraburkholderia sp. Ac-20340 TaxID=2703888 RepID=UPI0019823D9A|nr:Nramp family divalent metal transporter [Paraburkholderia sp. Ac-20340]MBN3855026.1 divalent metal cation transporter [Paraburkholderia sp. Ac-20340]
MSTGQPAGLTERTTRAIQDVLAGRRKGVLAQLLFAGPAVIASIAYVDPGNFATNLQAGAEFGYSLLWVVLCANLIAMLFQALSAKLGIVTQKNLAQLCREHLPRKLVYAMWAVSEIAAMATDLAEFLGGAIGLSLLLHLPLMEGMVITGIVTYAILLMEQQGYRPIELAIGAFVSIIALCYLLEVFVAPVSWSAALHGTLVPQLASNRALAVSAGILGATVMPHAIYLHSGLTQNRAPAKNNAERRTLLSFSNKETVVALTIAGMVNMAMVVMASAAFHAGHADIADVDTAWRTLTPLLGAGAAAVFLVSLLASGISSSVVGTMAGQMIMQGFVGFPVPVWVRRLVTMIPAFVVIALGMNATQALVYSQVVLSFALPVPMIALIVFTSRRDIMGEFANRRVVRFAALAGTIVVLVLNAVLILQTFGVSLPGLPAA